MVWLSEHGRVDVVSTSGRLGYGERFAFERRFHSARHDPENALSVVVTARALAGWANGSSALVGWQSSALIQGTTLVAGGASAAWMLDIDHQHEDAYYRSAGECIFELAALRGSSHLKLPRALAWAVGNANHAHPSAQGSRTTTFARRTSSSPCSRTPSRHHPQQHRRAAPDAVGRERGCLAGYPARRAPRRSNRPGRGTALNPELSSASSSGLDEPLGRLAF
jgi:hypothetical protein